MYSIFLADKEIEIIKTGTAKEFVQGKVIEAEKPFPFWEHFSGFISDKPGEKLILATSDPAWLFRYVATFFDPVEAAGGLVVNQRWQLLFIFRNGKWDLPKGHIDKGETITETALREVQEETGAKGLEIMASLPETYHVYESGNSRFSMKKTWWFLMKTNSENELKPQLKEQITRAEWFDIDRLGEIYSNTYVMIKNVVEYALKHYLLKS